MKMQKLPGFGLVSAATYTGIILISLAAQIGVARADEKQLSGDIGRGASLWGQTCSRCHNMRYPKEFRDDMWKPIVTHMRIRAGLTGQDSRDILSFLQGTN